MTPHECPDCGATADGGTFCGACGARLGGALPSRALEDAAVVTEAVEDRSGAIADPGAEAVPGGDRTVLDAPASTGRSALVLLALLVGAIVVVGVLPGREPVLPRQPEPPVDASAEEPDVAAPAVVLWQAPGPGGITSDPVVVGATVVVVGSDGEVTGFAVRDGRVRWSVRLDDVSGPPLGVSTSPPLHIAWGDGAVSAHLPDTGQALWVRRGMGATAPPSSHGGSTYFPGRDAAGSLVLHEVNATDGSSVRTVPLVARVSHQPLATQDGLVLCDDDGIITAYGYDDLAARWTGTVPGLVACLLDPVAGHVVWLGPTGAGALDFEGRTRWVVDVTRLGTAVTTEIAATDEGYLLLGRAALLALSRDGRTLWEAQLEEPSAPLLGLAVGEGSFTTVTAARDRLYNHDLRTGALNWQSAAIGPQVVRQPTTWGATVYVVASDGTLVALASPG